MTIRRCAGHCWYFLCYYRKRQMAVRLWRVGRQAIRRWSGRGIRIKRPRGTIGVRENGAIRNWAAYRLWGTGRGERARESAWEDEAVRASGHESADTGKMPVPPIALSPMRPDAGRASIDTGKLNTGMMPVPQVSAVERIGEGRFEFLNEERFLGNPIDWKLAGSGDVPRLWRFHLHYHEWLLEFARYAAWSGERRWLDRAWELVDQWIEACRPEEPWASVDAWHPYCISRRLPVWIALWCTGPRDDALGRRVLYSLFCQADYLARNLEWDLGGNHLLENLRALVLAGTFLCGPEADRWRRQAGRILGGQIEEQVLPHGEHFERSPMYHAAMLEAFLDMQAATADDMSELSRLCGETASRMAEFLSGIVHPDGEIPLLSDSAFGETAPTQQILVRASTALRSRPSALRPSPSAPYWVFRDGGDFLLFDAGPVGPDHLPAHAHADLLTIEASVAGRRLIVDSGVFDYEDGSMRRYCRSTAAHNVLQIDGEDQCDMWSRFRMGYRGWPRGLASGETEGFFWARAEHDAYRRLGVPRVGRWLACRTGGPWFCVDWAVGRGSHALTSRLQFHPDATVQKTSDLEITIVHHGQRLVLRYLTPGTVSVESGWYCPEFGRRILAPVVCWTATYTLPAVCGWSLSWGSGGGEAALRSGEEGTPKVVWNHGMRLVELRPFEGCAWRGLSWR